MNNSEVPLLPVARPLVSAADKVTVQLKWLPQAQFAGYYVAQSKGYYKAEGLDVTIKPGGPDISPVIKKDPGKAAYSHMVALILRGCGLLCQAENQMLG